MLDKIFKLILYVCTFIADPIIYSSACLLFNNFYHEKLFTKLVLSPDSATDRLFNQEQHCNAGECNSVHLKTLFLHRDMYFYLNAYICICCFFCYGTDPIPIIMQECSRCMIILINNLVTGVTLVGISRTLWWFKDKFPCILNGFHKNDETCMQYCVL